MLCRIKQTAREMAGEGDHLTLSPEMRICFKVYVSSKEATKSSARLRHGPIPKSETYSRCSSEDPVSMNQAGLKDTCGCYLSGFSCFKAHQIPALPLWIDEQCQATVSHFSGNLSHLQGTGSASEYCQDIRLSIGPIVLSNA